jgi:tripartite-type tricarboxylate transporter receptor subunit TctC
MYKTMSFDPQRDFASIVLVGKAPVIIVARPNGPANSLQGLIGYAKANPDKVTAGFPGNGTLGHITGKLLQERSGIKFGETQYRGSTPIITDLLGGHIDIAMDSMAAYVPQVQDGNSGHWRLPAADVSLACPMFPPPRRQGCQASKQASGTRC